MLLLPVVKVPFEGESRCAGVDGGTVARHRLQARAEAMQRLHGPADDAGFDPGAWEPRVPQGDAVLRIVQAGQSEGCDLLVCRATA